ncbi:hypothetical protein ACFLQ7_04010 [Actinomycetota bacterium]
MSLDEEHFGFKAQVEPAEPFEIDLFGNGAYPDAAWVIADIDEDLVRLEEVEVVPARPAGAWVGEYPGPFLPVTVYRFTASSLGESLLALEVRVGGQTIDRFEVTISVVEDACSAPRDGLIISANRC